MGEDLTDRVAVVTGGSRGLGRAIAMELARRGAFVVVNYHRHEKEAAQTVEAIRSAGGRGSCARADVTCADQIQEMFRAVYQEQKRVDVLVNNAGFTRDGYFLTMQQQSWQELIDIHLNGVFHCCKAVIRPMCAARQGVIITIGSGAALVAAPGQVNYSASKASLLGFCRSLAREVAGKGVRVLHMAPGFFQTDLTAGLDQRIAEESNRVTPLGRWGQPDELAGLVGFLASADAAYLTGQTVIIDGGRGAVETEYGF